MTRDNDNDPDPVPGSEADRAAAPDAGAPPAELFAVTFTGPPERNSMRLEGEGELCFEGAEVTVEGRQFPVNTPPRKVRFMFALGEIARTGLHDGAVVLEIRPAADPARNYFLSFYVASEPDARRLMGILHEAEFNRPASAESAVIERFYARLRRAPVWVTPALFAANVAVFILMWLNGSGVVNPDMDLVIRWGARFDPLVADGQWWRMLTPMFVHIGIIHLLFNMWALKNLGDFIERLYGPARFGLVYAGAGLTGCLLSYALHPGTVAAGASGAIFGIMGALVAFIYRRHQAIPAQVLANLRASALSFIGYNLLFGFMIQFIDNWAHLGGLGGGLVLGWLLAPARPNGESGPLRGTESVRKRRIYTGVLAAVLVGLMVLGQRATPPERIERAEIKYLAIEKCNALLEKKLGKDAPTCASLQMEQQSNKKVWRATALLSDGATWKITILDRGDDVDVIP